MRRAQSVRHHARPSLALGADDLGMLRESDETNEDTLRRQLLEKDRENDKLQTQVQLLQAQLAQRPPVEEIQAFEREYKNLDLLLQGTQRENERCMAELERTKGREKMLEKELSRLAGENWQSALDIPTQGQPSRGLQRGLLSYPTTSSPVPSLPAAPSSDPHEQNSQKTFMHIEQVRLLILGMEERLRVREQQLEKTVKRAEEETVKVGEKRTEILESMETVT